MFLYKSNLTRFSENWGNLNLDIFICDLISNCISA
jgi:hypothetical protein